MFGCPVGAGSLPFTSETGELALRGLWSGDRANGYSTELSPSHAFSCVFVNGLGLQSEIGHSRMTAKGREFALRSQCLEVMRS